MSKQMTFPLSYGTSISDVVAIATQNLQAQGYDVQSAVMSPEAASMTISMDRDGFKNIIGLGVECRVMLNIYGGQQLNINIDSEWTNKIIAMAVGWFLCFVPFITGIVGSLKQNDMPKKVSASIQTALASANTGYAPQQNGYQPQYQQYGQPQYQQPQYQQPQYQQPQQNNNNQYPQQ